MNVMIIDKEVVECLNAMNKSNHKPNIIELTDGRACIPAKLLNEPLYEGYQKYFRKCQVEEVGLKLFKNNSKTLENASNKI